MSSQSETTSSTDSDLYVEPDDILLYYMESAEENPELARSAWMEFYNRHYRYLFCVCERFTKKIGGRRRPEDLVQDVFGNAYRGAGTFQGNGLTGKALTTRVRQWLGGIANNILRTWMGIDLPVAAESLQPGYWENVPDTSEEQSESTTVDSGRLRLVEEAMALLSDDEQHILRITFAHHDLSKKHQRLPNHVSQELARALGTTTDNIRQMRYRAVQKVKTYIQSRM